MLGVVVLVIALVVAVVGGAVYQRRNGRVRPVAANQPTLPSDDGIASLAAAPTALDPAPTALDPAVLAALAALVPEPGERATLLQFSSAFCAPCRATKRILAEVAELVPGVRHVEIDAESHLDEVRALDIRRTPTTLILSGNLGVVARASGQPRRDEVLATLAEAVA